MRENGRSERPQNRTDAITSGRSMVEMLGVLAIIGVLSVGAMSGYSKAMFKYKLNKQTEQLSTVFNAVARYAHSFNEVKSGYITHYFIKLGEIPTEMIHPNNSQNIYDIFNMNLSIIKEVYENNVSIIAIYMSPELLKKSSQNLDICKNIILTIKENSDSVRYLQTYSDVGTDNENRVIYYGDNHCTKNCIRDITLDDIYRLCTTHFNKEKASLYVDWFV